MRKQKPLKLVSWGKEKWESTTEFANKVSVIKNDVREKHATALAREKNLFKKLWIQILILVEIRRRIEQISSHKNLHIKFTG